MKLPLATLFEAPTIEELARILRREDSPTGWSPLVAIRAFPAHLLLHLRAGGNVIIYREFAQRLGADQPFYGLQAIGLDASCPPDLRALAYKAKMHDLELRIMNAVLPSNELQVSRA